PFAEAAKAYFILHHIMSNPTVLYKLSLENRRILHVTNFGIYRPNFVYNGLSLRLGWAGYLLQQSGARFTICIEQCLTTHRPIFLVTDPEGNDFRATNPTQAIKDSGFVTKKAYASGPLHFGLNTDFFAQLNQPRCVQCSEEARTEDDIEKYVYLLVLTTER